MDINKYRQKLERLKGQREQLQSSIKQNQTQIKKYKRDQRNAEQAQVIIQTVAKQTQDELTFYISDLVSSALEAVFGKDAYQFCVEFVQKRNKTECELSFIRDGEKMNPMTDSGGGAVDVASLALRICLWSIQQPKSRNTIIMDEPGKWVSENYQSKVSEMIKEISKRLGIQFIIVSHQKDMIDYADKVFEVEIKKGVSHVS